MAPGVRGLSDNNNDLYFSVKAFHLKWQELPLDANVKKWSVHILSLDRQRRHLDRATLNMFWEVLDKYVLFIFIQRFSVVDKLYVRATVILSVCIGSGLGHHHLFFSSSSINPSCHASTDCTAVSQLPFTSFNTMFHLVKISAICSCCSNSPSEMDNWTHRATDGPPGAVRQPYQNWDAQRNQTHILHFCKATAKPNF